MPQRPDVQSSTVARSASVAAVESIDERQRAIIDEIPGLRRYALALLRDRDAADDLVQDSLVRALSRIASWTTGDSPRRWLFTLMHNLFVDQLRRARLHVQAVATMPEAIDATSVSPPQIDRLASVEVLAALRQVGPERRMALVLVAVEGVSYADAANTLGIPAGTLMSRVARGRQELRSILDDMSRRRAIRVIKK
jgi:RNA polymerase sigma-70 factor (ECF subfamily)